MPPSRSHSHSALTRISRSNTNCSISQLGDTHVTFTTTFGACQAYNASSYFYVVPSNTSSAYVLWHDCNATCGSCIGNTTFLQNTCQVCGACMSHSPARPLCE